MTERYRTLIVAFDGLDYELIRRYDCQNIIQSHFGRVDNTTGISSRITPELFASFITGKNYRDHGVFGFYKWGNKLYLLVERLAHLFIKGDSLLTRRLVRWTNRTFEPLGGNTRYYNRNDLDVPTIFDQIPNSRALFVPSYCSESVVFFQKAFMEGGEVAEARAMLDEAFNERRKVFFDEVEKGYDLLMYYIFKVDGYQHLFYDSVRDEKVIRSLYLEMDQYAREVKERALEEGFEWILFMSDHGVPEGVQHNKNAFFSSNLKMDVQQPKITDFFEMITDQSQLG